MSITPQTKSTFISFAMLQHPGSGKVLEVRPWQDAPFIEMDLHLPAIDMYNWTNLIQISFHVSDHCLSGDACLTAEIQKLLRNLGHPNIQIFLETCQLIHQNLKS